MDIFTGSFIIMSTLGYLIPSGIFHFCRKYNTKNIIQKNKEQKIIDIKREIKLSFQTITIWSLMNVYSTELIFNGHTKIFFDIEEASFFYNVTSFLLCFIIHDTYFYWFHRLMHHKYLYKYTHKGHHLSVTPTPWAALSFQPGEAIIQYFQFSIIPFMIYVNIYVFLLYLFLDVIINTAGHSGYELVDERISKNKYLKYLNTVKHHDDHHTKFNKNFGAFFNIWDRICDTYSE